MMIEEFIQRMPKVELHVHLEGSVRPETLLRLADRHHIPLPAGSIEGVRAWYRFRDFAHFVEIYMTISSCLRTADDIELIAREFLIGQAEQHVLYSEVTFTPYNQLVNCGLGFHEQIDAVNRARSWGEQSLGVSMGMIIDIPRERSPEAGDQVAGWVIDRFGDGVIALGLAGPERGNPPSKFRNALGRARDRGIPRIIHAGESDGPASIWNALEIGEPARVGHGVRAIEDPALLAHLREFGIPLEVCLSSNVCLGVYPTLTSHSLPKLIGHGLRITINSDDPPMFNTSLTNEFIAGADAFGWDSGTIRRFVFEAVESSLLPPPERSRLRERVELEFSLLEVPSSNSSSPLHK
jgi:adenosine deaminase